MKIDKETLLKNRFWIALGGAGLLVLGSIVVLFLGAGPRASSARANYLDFETKLKNQKDFKNSSFVEPWTVRKNEFTGRKDKVWADAWKTQDRVMTWPKGEPFLENLEKTGHFGDSIDENVRIRYRDKLYLSQFDNFKEFLNATSSDDAYLPVAFDPKLLNQYKWAKDKTPTDEECWLAQEEIWLRREVFRILQAALDSMATFKEIKELRWNAAVAAVAGVPADALVKQSPNLSRAAYKQRPLDPKLANNRVKESRLFRSHDWEVNLLLEEPERSSQLRVSASSTIKNINPSRRPLSLVNSTGQGLRLQVRQQQGKNSQGKPIYTYYLLKPISGVQLPYGEHIKFTSASDLGSIKPDRDFELVEVFDPATSPIKRLEKLEIGDAALAHRLKVVFDMKNGPLAPPSEEGDKEQSSSGQPGGGAGQGSSPPGGGGGSSGGAMPGGGGAMPGGAGAGKKTDLSKTANEIPRNRYILHNEVVRRIPIAFTVVLDQDYRNEVLTAVANSPLRIQTTQVYWAHQGEKAVASAGGKSNSDWSGSSSPPGTSGPGGAGSQPPGGAAGPGGAGSQPPGGSAGPGGAGSQPPGGAASPGGAGSRPPGGSTSGSRPMQSGGASENAPSVDEGTRNLIGFTVHGIATLYERFPPKKKEEGPKPAGPPK